MEPSDVAALARIWADSVPLSTFVDDRVKQLPDEPTTVGAASTATQPATRKKRASARARSNIETVAASLTSMSAALELGRKQSERIDRVRAAMMNDMIAGRLSCIGRPSASYEFKRIDPSFWIGARVQWYGNAVIRGDDTLIEVRVMSNPNSTQIQDRPQKGPGRPSKADAIRAAITAHAKSDAGLNQPPLERYRAYRSYLSEKGFDLRKQSGFSNKTFEKYEREFRRQVK